MTTIKKIIENADNAYYAAEYDKAMQFYMQVLDLAPDNKHAQQQLRKAEFNRPSESIKPKDVPIQALQLYKRSRSFITAGNLTLARKLLQQAIDIAEENGVDFPNAQDLLGNIKNALKAEEFKKKAFEELDTQQWAKAVGNLNSAINLDPTDDAVQTLLSHLSSLLKAQHLINSLNAGSEEIRSRSLAVREIRKIINLTNETTALSKLWQEVVKLFGEYNNKRYFFREIVLVALCAGAVLLLVLWLFYLFPRNHAVVNCDSVAPDLQATLNYPFYIANGDEDKVEITFTNVGDKAIDGLVVFGFEGTANVKLVAPTYVTGIKIIALNPGEKASVAIHFALDDPFRAISNPGNYVDFRICPANIASEDYHIAMSPIYGLRKLITFLWGTVGFTLIGLFWSQIKDWLLSLFRRNSG